MFSRKLTFEEKTFWGTLLFASIAIGYLLVSLIQSSTKEESAYLQSNYLNRAPKIIILETTFGEIRILLLRSQAPITVNNFVSLADSGFYDKTKFHRIVKDLLIQGGDPLSRESDQQLYGTGGPGYVFDDEILADKMERGAVAMANLGRPKTNGSQFFIVVAEDAPILEGKYTIFGRVIVGMDVVDKINSVEVNAKNIPLEPVIIESISIE